MRKPRAKPKILIVDDKPENLYSLNKLLAKLEVEVIQTTSGFDALELVLQHDFCLAIVDIQMPEMDGYELVELLRSNTSTATLPVIFVSAIYSDEYHHRKGYDAGAVDFLSKPFVPEILLSKVKVFLDLYKQRLQLEQLVQELHQANAILARRAVQLETSAQVSHQVISILDVSRLLAEIVSLIQAKFGYYFVSVWLADMDQNRITLQANQGAQEGPRLAPGFSLACNPNESIIAHVCHTAEAYLADDVRDDDRYLAVDALPDVRSELALPLQIGEMLLGVLDIQSERPSAFEPDDITVLQTLADQIAIAIRNAQLYAEVVRFNEELEGMVQERTAELQKAYEQLERLDRNKSDFIQVAAHELRTPLTLIRGYGQLLLTSDLVEGNKKYHQQVAGIMTGADRMHEIVNSMLDMARIDSRTLDLVVEPVSLPALLDGLKQELDEALVERNLSLVLQDMPTMPYIEADPDALRKLFDHLLINAIKYTPDGGRITVSGRPLQPGPANPATSFVELVVSDNGIGIDPEFHELIFAKFYQTGEVSFHSTGRTKFKGGGPGLGLAIARGIVEAHGGRIWVESPGYDEQTCPGSQFHVVLPVERQPANVEPAALRAEPGYLSFSSPSNSR